MRNREYWGPVTYRESVKRREHQNGVDDKSNNGFRGRRRHDKYPDLRRNQPSYCENGEQAAKHEEENCDRSTHQLPAQHKYTS